MRYLVALFLLCMAGIASGQTLTGHITDKDNGRVLYPVRVTNLSTQTSVLSDNNGGYAIEAKPGEYVAFTYMGYKALQKAVPFGVVTNELNVELQSISLVLPEVVIGPNLTKYQRDSIERKANYSRVLAARRAGIGSPFSMVAEQFSRKAKRKFRFQKNFLSWEAQQFIDTRYTPEMVYTLTKLDGDTLAHFMNSYPMPYDYARAASELELKMWIRFHYREYMKEEKFRNIPVISDSLMINSKQ